MNFTQLLPILFCFLGLSVQVLGQDKVDAALDAMAQEACDCAAKKDLDGLSQDELQMTLGLCLIEGLGNHQDALEGSMYEADMSDQDGMRIIGEEIGLRMATRCPDMMLKMIESNKDEIEAAIEERSITATKSLRGTLVEVRTGDFVRILVEDASGSRLSLLWLEPFNGDNALVGNPEALKGSTVEVIYVEKELYNPKTYSYYTQKVLYALSEL